MTSSFRLLPALLLLAGLRLVAATPEPAPADFITRRGDRLFEGDREFRWVSVNAPDSFQLITNYRFDLDQPAGRYRLPDDYELRDCVRTVRQMGGRVMRTFVITCHRGPNPISAFDVAVDPVAPNEAALQVLDRLLQICHEEGVRLIIPLVAYNSSVRGDWHTYGDEFWTVGSPANRKFKEVVRQVLTRTNTRTGRSYLDDPAILGWQTGNELVIGDAPDRRAWLHDFAAFFKSVDRRHLLIDGRNKPNDVYDRYAEFSADPNIDAVSYHTYVNLPQADSPAGTLRLIRDQLRGKIPVIVTEIAMYTKPDALRALLDEIMAGGAVGGNWWAIRFHNRDGGFYKHSDRGSQFEDLNWPGFADPAGYLPEIGRERELLGILTDYAARIAGTPPVAPVRPDAPTFLPASDPGHLAWQGATGASSYDLERAPAAAGPWTTLAPDLTDNLAVYTPLYCDTDAVPGREYFYRVIARNAAGASAPSNVVGPIRPDRRWLVDDLFDASRCDARTANVRIDKAYAHGPYLEDVAVAVRADATKPARLVYRVPGAIRHFSVTAFEVAPAPRFFTVSAGGERTELVPQRTAYDGGKRARLAADLPATATAGTLEIELPAGAPAGQAIGRVELAWVPLP